MSHSEHKCCCCRCQPEAKRQDDSDYLSWLLIVVFAVFMGLASSDKIPGLSLSTHPANPANLAVPADSLP